MTASLSVACLVLCVWIYLIFCRGGFWRAGERDDAGQLSNSEDGDWPTVAVIIPARDEAPMLPRGLSSILDQNYPNLSVVLVDDNSSDDTAAAACQIAAGAGREAVILQGKILPPAWTGKLWALHQGIIHAQSMKLNAPLSAADGRGHPLCARRH